MAQVAGDECRAASPPLDQPRERGFIPFDRALFESEMLRSFTAQQRAVVLELYGLANWAPRPFFARGERIEVGRGELAHSLRTIAERIPGCTKDVVDGVVSTLQRGGGLEARHPTAQPTDRREEQRIEHQ
jgi:hypothetical protein